MVPEALLGHASTVYFTYYFFNEPWTNKKFCGTELWVKASEPRFLPEVSACGPNHLLPHDSFLSSKLKHSPLPEATTTETKMVFRAYAPATKIAAGRMSLEEFNQPTICNTLGYNISRQLFKRGMDLFELAKCVVRKPDTNASRGLRSSLTSDEINFIIDLVQSESGFFCE
ncbi:hypothetical protein VP01_2926g1 [Puccinia sorghi]|uniref:Uncharacterized protein n=1 Tax=Puccinia sorghi TaxID=27349 RepID=A0A0L6V204_9BASI|nr:hypothetical protein VP01_2926g1 [Puccinia sorghi]